MSVSVSALAQRPGGERERRAARASAVPAPWRKKKSLRHRHASKASRHRPHAYCRRDGRPTTIIEHFLALSVHIEKRVYVSPPKLATTWCARLPLHRSSSHVGSWAT
eukprot:scaffold13456_cov115-Isochrysis_galbana.AAC.4